MMKSNFIREKIKNVVSKLVLLVVALVNYFVPDDLFGKALPTNRI